MFSGVGGEDGSGGVLMDSLTRANLEFSRRYPGDSGLRQPVHAVYGGAHLFKADGSRKLGAMAEKTLHEYAPL